MAGPWVSLKSDPEFAVITRWEEAGVIEIKCVDDEGKHQGNALLVTESRLRNRLFCCYLVAASDKEYNEWMRSGEGHPNPGYYRQAIGTVEDKDIKYRKENVILVKEWRHICQSNALMDLGAIKWIPKNKIAPYTKVIIERMETILEKKKEETRERSKTPPERNRKRSKTRRRGAHINGRSPATSRGARFVCQRLRSCSDSPRPWSERWITGISPSGGCRC